MVEPTYTFLQLAEEALGTATEPLDRKGLWHAAHARGLTAKLKTKGQTPWETLGSQLYVATQNDPTSVFERIGARPTRFWLKARPLPTGWSKSGPSAESLAAPVKPVATPAKKAWLEKELHPLLASFAHSHLDGVYVKTVRHTASSKASFGEWVHPDLVGVRFPGPTLAASTLKFSQASASGLARLFSFELKRRVDFTNLREAFFQTVSNSSWAHSGYLVAGEWDDDSEFLDELRRLCLAFGIGAIHLNLGNFDDSHVLIPARPRDELDWSTLDKLVRMNPDVASFLDSAAVDLDAAKVHKSEYDQLPPNPQQLAASLVS